MIVVDMELRADVFRLRSRLARLDRVAAAGGEPERSLVAETEEAVGGR